LVIYKNTHSINIHLKKNSMSKAFPGHEWVNSKSQNCSIWDLGKNHWKNGNITNLH
jgi:hypothetical protein